MGNGDDLATRSTHGALAAPLGLDDDGARRLYEAFLAGRNANTRRAYQQSARDFADYLTRRFGRPLSPESALGELLQAGHGPANLVALDYRADLLARCAPGTVSLRLSNLRAAVKLARMLGMIPWGLETPSVKVEKYSDTEGPGLSAVQAIATALRKRAGSRAARDRALLALLYGQGLRRGEIVELDVVHVDLENGRVSILGKGRLEREWVKLSSDVLEAVRTWIGLRPGEACGPLFLGWRGRRVAGRLTGRAVAKLTRGWGLAAAGKPVRPHGLRHTAATALLDAGLPWQEVAAFTRHRDPSTLAKYDDNRRRRGSAAAARLADLVKL